jgi:hypothetical protein
MEQSEATKVKVGREPSALLPTMVTRKSCHSSPRYNENRTESTCSPTISVPAPLLGSADVTPTTAREPLFNVNACVSFSARENDSISRQGGLTCVLFDLREIRNPIPSIKATPAIDATMSFSAENRCHPMRMPWGSSGGSSGLDIEPTRRRHDSVWHCYFRAKAFFVTGPTTARAC